MDRSKLFVIGASYKPPMILEEQYKQALKASEWIRTQPDQDFIQECFSTRWYHMINFDGFSTRKKEDQGWQMDRILREHFPLHLMKPSEDQKIKTVIDLGAADGLCSATIEKECQADVLAVDLFDLQLKHMEITRRYFECKFKIQKEDALGDLSHLGRFDVLFCSNLIPHIGLYDPVNTVKKEDFLEGIKCLSDLWIFCTNNFNFDDIKLMIEKYNGKEYSKFKYNGQKFSVVVCNLKN